MNCFDFEFISENNLEKQDYHFWLDENTIVLNRYYHSTRATKRHGWKADKSYNRILSRDSTIKFEDIPMNQFIINKIKEKVIASLIVVRHCRDTKEIEIKP